jgi:uncharacterized protein YciI
VRAQGGVTIFKAPDRDEATRIGNDDPTVQSGILNVDMKMLRVPFHT